VNADILLADTSRPAGFWIRVVAAIVDLVFVFIVQFSLGFVGARVWGAEVEGYAVFQALVVLFTIAFTALYTTLLHAITGQTLGKMLVGVRVMATDGAPLLVGAALLRYFGYFASVATLGLGFLMAAWRRDKRALHDLIAGSRVERRRVARRELQVVPPVV
jgi:uncharacterized RDD family membrane protein YckC